MSRSYKPSHRGRRKLGPVAITLAAAAAVVVIGGVAWAMVPAGGNPGSSNTSLSGPVALAGGAAAGTGSGAAAGTAGGTPTPGTATGTAPATKPGSKPGAKTTPSPGATVTSSASPASAPASPSSSPADGDPTAPPSSSQPSRPGSPTAQPAPTQNQGTLAIADSLSLTDTLGDTVDIGTTASGGTAPYTWTVTGLPSGVTASSGGYGQAAVALSGVAAAAGSYPFTVTLSDSGQHSLTERYTLTVLQPSSEQWSVEPLNLTQATVGTPYSGSLGVTNGVTVTWAVTAGSLPPGLSLNPSTGTITGTPAARGLFNFSIVATNVATGSSKQGGTYNFVVYPPGS